uniref:Uncharacterized protein n=1 Tax=Nelumbo nucifera TaxID=4432 RepID=A0A822YCA2_NELNU|nr:TPA_asm: hypothetical protein HUJ06_031555 [Nelumbo nucifera]
MEYIKGLFVNKIDRCELKEGDHIYCWRSLYIHAHHGWGIDGLSSEPCFRRGIYDGLTRSWRHFPDQRSGIPQGHSADSN